LDIWVTVPSPSNAILPDLCMAPPLTPSDLCSNPDHLVRDSSPPCLCYLQSPPQPVTIGHSD
jgi:hypothetical protein